MRSAFEQFLDYVKNGRYERSYKMIFFKVFFEYCDEMGRIEFDLLCKKIEEYYKRKVSLLEKIEKESSEPQKNYNSFDYKTVKGTMKKTVLRTLKDNNGDKTYFQELQANNINYIYIDRDLWQDRDNKLIKEVIDIMDEKLEEYYNQFEIEDTKAKIKHIKKYIEVKGFTYSDLEIENFYLSLKTKPFVILAGISGTGKTKLVELFAEAVGANYENNQMKLIPVKPNWNDGMDLIGYKNLNGDFIAGEIIEVLKEAIKEENKTKPYFICLDEMNLARVEHYFSDFLSVMETRKFRDGEIKTKPLIPLNMLEGEYVDIYKNIFMPQNVFIIGTVNMDETTFPFSKKVLDRANTIEFSSIDLSIDFMYLNEEKGSIPFDTKFLKSRYLILKDMINVEEKEFLKKISNKLIEINKILEHANDHIGYRVRDEILAYMCYNKRYELMSEEEAFDIQMIQKIMPRIQGSGYRIENMLEELINYFCGEDKESCKYKRTLKKLEEMLEKHRNDDFTSFWS